MLDISQARRLSTIAYNRAMDEQEVEYEILSEWEQKAIDFMSEPGLHDILFQFVDDCISTVANAGTNEREAHIYMSSDDIGRTRYTRGPMAEEPLLYHRFACACAEYREPINELVIAYDFLDVEDDKTIVSLLWGTLVSIIFPIYIENGYQVDISHPASLTQLATISW